MKTKEIRNEEPNFRAEFFGGMLDGWVAYFSDPYPEWRMIVPVRDKDGREIKRQCLIYRLESQSPHLIYRFVKSEDWKPPHD